MKPPRIAEAMNYIDDELIAEAVMYRRAPLPSRLFRKPIWKACAWFLTIIIILIAKFAFSRWNNVNKYSFAITAYAMSESGTVSNALLTDGKRIPVSIFEADSGLKGFVLSCPKTDESVPSSVIIISNGAFSQDSLKDISGITNDPTQKYYFYIPGDNESAPYTVPLFRTDKKTGTLYQCVITITQINESYFSELTEENITERIVR